MKNTKVISNLLREKIRRFIKNKKDISELIKGYSIKGENLSRAIIKDFDGRICDECSGVNLNFAILGEEGKTTDIGSSIFQHSNLKRARFLGRWLARKTDFRYSNLSGAYLPHVEYQFADLRHVIFCNTTFVFGTNVARGAKISKELFEALLLIYKVDFDVEIKEKE